MALTGRPDGPPLGPPPGLVPGLDAVAERLERHTTTLGSPVVMDPLAVLVERASAQGLTRGGTTSCGGSTRLLPTADGWIAVALARPDDVELLPAWLGIAPPPDDVWAAVARAVAPRTAPEVVAQGRLLGLPVARLPEPTQPPEPPEPATPRTRKRVRGVAGSGGWVSSGGWVGSGKGVTAMRDVVVVDLSSLWAGPLCGALLVEAGAHVLKVESAGRPDGARLGSPAFFDRLNGAKQSVLLDLPSADGVAELRRLISTADVVIEASRPRALQQMGIDAQELMAGEDGPRVWASITAHGRTGERGSWVGFGDDAAVAGGLVVSDGEGPCFCADAVADPITGMVAAAAIAEALTTDERALLDLPLSATAARFTGRER